MRNFEPNPNKAIREADRNNPELKFHSFCISSTSFRCNKVTNKLKNIFSKYTPYFRVNIIYKTITLENIILPRLKPVKPMF